MMALAALWGCNDATGPVEKPPYLAVVTILDAPGPAELGRSYTYRVQELSGTLKIDTLITARPTDTVIVSLPPATYVVTLEEAPARCRFRDGLQQGVVLIPGSNTSILRFIGVCQSQLLISTLTDGPEADSLYVYGITFADGSRKVGLMRLRDTVRINDAPSGLTSVDLAEVSGNCAVTSDGGPHRQFMLDSTGGVDIAFRVLCSVLPDRPSLLSLRGEYHDEAAGIVLRATDPNRDLNAYVWDITDCHQHTLLPNGARYRPGLGSGATAGQDTVLVLAAMEAGLPDSVGSRACAAVYVVDAEGNTSPITEVPLRAGPGSSPAAVSYNARLNGTSLLTTQLSAGDPDGDFLGVFAAAGFRDGTFGTGDGKPDLVLYNVSGFLSTQVPDLYFSQIGVSYENVSFGLVYLFDAAGHFTRLVDTDLFQ
jgi:hypothetical protein